MEKGKEEILKEYQDAVRMYRTIMLTVDRNSPAQCEKFHYWDGKRNGLGFALQALGIHIPRKERFEELYLEPKIKGEV